jgi:predicted aspartyl protease
MGKRRSNHLSVEIDEHQVHGLVDAGASMFVISTNTIRGLGLMHLVVGSKIDKTVLVIIT